VKTPSEEAFVFNIVWTGKVFTYLRYFVASQIAHSDARFRFVVNGCPPEQIELMERFATSQPDRVTDVLVVRDEMGAHGVALDAALDRRDDGEFFCFIDPDILARGPFVADFAAVLQDGTAGVTSGRGVWRDDDVLPEGQVGVSGEYFYAPDGFLFGSPHFAMYRRGPLDETLARWEVGFGSAGPRRLSDEAKQHLQDIKRDYMLYDTGKLVNIFLQEDGQLLRHFEHPNLMHIGGMSHYLSPPDGGGGAEEAGWQPDQTRWPWPVGRLEVALYTAAVLRSLCDGQPAPGVPAEVDPALAPRLEMVRGELVTLVDTYQETVDRA
jgi:hypothetical protein